MTNNSAAIRKTVLLTAKPGLGEELRQALIELQNASRPEPGCRFFTFYQALDDPSAFVLVEDFVNAGAMETHMRLPHTRAFFAASLVAESRVFLDASAP